jgi:hypothetical protein
MTAALYAAGAVNLSWGTFVVLFPLALFRWAGMAAPRYPGLWQFVGMLVGVYGIGYLAVARDPLTHWPVVLVGLIAKILAPIGYLVAAARDEISPAFGAATLANDVLWWIPFGLILVHAYRRHAIHLRLARDHRSLRRA